MTDRKLLEDAARAAGMPHKWIPMLGKMLHIIDAGRSEEWNPLTDDGDALRLAVRLRLQIEWSRTLAGGKTEHCHVSPRGHGHLGDGELVGDDPGATLRRLIVRAAAAMAPSPAEREA